MELAKTHKTLILSLTFIAGIAFTLLKLLPVFMTGYVFLAFFFAFRKYISYKFAIVCLMILGFSVFYTNYKQPEPDSLAKLAPTKAELRGRVVTEPRGDLENRTKFQFEVMMIKKTHWENIKAKTLVTIFDKERKFRDIKAGDVIELYGRIKLPYKVMNPGQFDYGKYLKNSKIFTLTYVRYDDYKILEHPKKGKWFLIQNINKLRDKIISVHKKYLKSPKSEILGGLVFGDAAIPAPDEVKQNFINAGLLHLLAASGMNVAMIFGMWFFLAQKACFPYRLNIVIGMVLVAAYSVMTGLPPSVTRAAWMLEFGLMGKLIDRKADNVALLALVAAIMLLIDPLLINNIGFQLSFLVAFGLLVCMPVFMKKIKAIPSFISGIILIPTVAQAWAGPIQLFHFNNFAFYSILANIIVAPFIGILSFFGFISSTFSLIPVVGGKICWFLDKCSEPFISVLLFVSEFISKLPGALHHYASPGIAAILLFYILILLFTLQVNLDFSKKALNYVSLAIIASLITISICSIFTNNLKIVFFSVGEADSILIQTPEKKYILVDTADTGLNGFNSATTIIIPYLREIGVNKLDALILTHPDRDHIGGTIDILENINVKQVYENGESSNSKIYRKIRNYISAHKVKDLIITRNQKINLDKNIEIQAIRPKHNDPENKNEDSIILYLKYKDFSGLLMADNNTSSIDLIKKYVKAPVKIIKIGHHGSYNALSDYMIKYLKPEYAVISVGKNDYGHPDPASLELLKKYNIRTLRTDKDYEVEASTNGKNLKIKTFKES